VLRTVLAAALGVAVIAGVVAIEGATVFSVTACTTTDASTVLSPQTGIIVQADPLVSPYGCGEMAGQVYKYAAVLVDINGHLVTAQIYDCFADGTFVNLAGATTADAANGFAYTILVYAWTFESYKANYDAIANAIGVVNAAGASDAGNIQNPFLIVPATWATTCQAVQTTNIEQIAVCAPLTAEGQPMPPPASDAGDAATEAGDAATADAGDAATIEGDAGDGGEQSGDAGDSGSGGGEDGGDAADAGGHD